MFQQIVTRCGLLFLVAVSACFSPKFDDGKITCGPDNSCPPGQSCFNGLCSAEDPGPIDARNDAPSDAAVDAPVDAPDAPPSNVTLTITYSGTGKGSVTGTGLTCDANGCTGSFAPDTSVTITQSPMTGSDFTMWEGACASAGTNPQCTLTLTADTTTNAVFTLKQHRLNIAMAGNGIGMVTGNVGSISCSQNGSTTTGMCSAPIEHGTQVILTQGGAGSGSSFLGWSGASCSGTGATCTFTIEADTTINAPFGLNNTLVVSGAGNGLGTIASQNDASINCTSDRGATSGACSHTYGSTTNVQLLATADQSSTFTGWTGGGCSPTVNPCTVSVAAAVGVTATFSLKKYTVTVSKANNGADTGSGVVTGNGISCGSSCGVMVDHGTQLTFTQVANTGSTFQGWASTPAAASCMGTASCTVTVNQDTNVVASYLLNKYPISVATNPANGSRGVVTSSIGGINCPSGNCTAMLNYGTMVTMTASPVTGYRFTQWTNGPCNGMTSPMCAFTVTGMNAMTANFEPSPFDLTVQTTGNGAGMVTAANGLMCMTGSTANCTKTYLFGDMIQLTATASATSNFTGFSGGGCGATSPCTVPINGNVTVQAQFTLKQYALTVNKDAASTGTGTVTSDVGGINCGTGCTTATSSQLNHGTMVTLTAAANSPSSVFAGWTGGACTGTSTTCVVTMDAAKSATARFNIATYAVRIDKQGTGSGTVTGTGFNCGADCTETVAYNTSITFTAAATMSPASQLSTFKGWNVAGCTTGTTCTVTITGATSIMPTFDMNPNYAFVTQSPVGGMITNGIVGADAYCAQEANEAFENGTLPAGTYKAWMSTTSASAISRLGTASGWVRQDGRVFARSKDDLIAGKALHPLRINEAGGDVGAASVWTGTVGAGTVDTTNCTNWTTTSGSGTVGRAYGVGTIWTDNGTLGCGGTARIYCLGVDRVAPLPAVTPPGGRKAFISSTSFNVTTGIAGADALCASDATTAGLTGTFKALIATTSATALSRFSTSGTAWERVDGVRISTTAAGITGALLLSAINVTAGGTYLSNAGAWTGAPNLTTVGTTTTTCSNWTVSTGATGIAGTAADSTSGAFGDTATSGCGSSFRVYCLQQ